MTRQPSNEFGWSVEATGGQFRRMDIRGFADLPIISDRLLSTVAFSTKSRDGYQRRIQFPGADNFVTDDINQFLQAGYRTSDLPNGTTLTSITAYRELEWDAGMDLDGSPVSILEPSFRMSQTQRKACRPRSATQVTPRSVARRSSSPAG